MVTVHISTYRSSLKILLLPYAMRFPVNQTLQRLLRRRWEGGAVLE